MALKNLMKTRTRRIRDETERLRRRFFNFLLMMECSLRLGSARMLPWFQLLRLRSSTPRSNQARVDDFYLRKDCQSHLHVPTTGRHFTIFIAMTKCEYVFKRIKMTWLKFIKLLIKDIIGMSEDDSNRLFKLRLLLGSEKTFGDCVIMWWKLISYNATLGPK